MLHTQQKHQREIDKNSHQFQASHPLKVQQNLDTVKAQLSKVISDQRNTIDGQASRIKRLSNQILMVHKNNEEALLRLEDNLNRHISYSGQYKKAINGDIIMVTTVDENVSAADLNAGAAGSIRHRMIIRAEAVDGRLHQWLNGLQPTITPDESVTDVDVGVPVIEWAVNSGSPPEFVDGVLDIWVIPDIDAGATKTHAVADEYSATIDMTGLAIAVNVPNLVRTFTVTA